MNTKNIPKKPVMGNDVLGLGEVVYQVPSCPTCYEPTYSLDECGFCSQLLDNTGPCGKESCSKCDDYPCFDHFGPQLD